MAEWTGLECETLFVACNVSAATMRRPHKRCLPSVKGIALSATLLQPTYWRLFAAAFVL